jgi:hypothetical protein
VSEILEHPAAEINRLHCEIEGELRTTLVKAIRIGELLAAQKVECGHGGWLRWLETNINFSQQTANVYMRCYGHRSKLLAAGNLTLRQALEMISHHPTEEEQKKLNDQERERQNNEKAAKKAACLAIIAKEIEDPEKQTEAWSKAVEKAEKHFGRGALPSLNMAWRVAQPVKEDPNERAARDLQTELRQQAVAGSGHWLDSAKWNVQKAINDLRNFKEVTRQRIEPESIDEITAKLSEICSSIDELLTDQLIRELDAAE